MFVCYLQEVYLETLICLLPAGGVPRNSDMLVCYLKEVYLETLICLFLAGGVPRNPNMFISSWRCTYYLETLI